tara:strand:- start:35 stop:280 length:246 start_codon:yes stop_codon:yes gene_type:complete
MTRLIKLNDFNDAIDEYAKTMGLRETTNEYMAFRTGVADGEERGSELSAGMTYEDLDCQDSYDKGTHLGVAIRVAITGMFL